MTIELEERPLNEIDAKYYRRENEASLAVLHDLLHELDRMNEVRILL